MLQNIEEFFKIYNLILVRLYPNSNFVLENNFKNREAITKFIEKFTFVGENFLWDYIVYQFSKYSKVKDKIVHLNWIIGQKAINRWENRTEQELYWLHSYKEKFGLVKPSISNYTMSDDYKDLQRELYYNTERGFINCQEFGGLLFDIKNKFCSRCLFKEICKNGNI